VQRTEIKTVSPKNVTGLCKQYTIIVVNGHPGDLYSCSKSETFRAHRGGTYLLRIVNAALNKAQFFKIAGHEFPVVAVDASYTQPYKTDVIVTSPGQTTDVLVTANQTVGQYYMAVRPFSELHASSIDNTTATAIFPSLPVYNDTATVATITRGLRSMASLEYPVDVPRA